MFICLYKGVQFNIFEDITKDLFKLTISSQTKGLRSVISEDNETKDMDADSINFN